MTRLSPFHFICQFAGRVDIISSNKLDAVIFKLSTFLENP